MDNLQIGIRMADGSFFPVFDQNFQGRKKLILTTARNDQTSVQIDLYKGQDGNIIESLYIGSLIIENIEPAPKREPEIELVIGIDSEGNLNATASDKKTGERQTLSVSLESLSEEQAYTIPDFELNGDINEVPEQGEEDIQLTQTDSLVGESYPVTEEDRRKTHLEKKPLNPLLLIGFIVGGLIIIGAAIFLIWWLLSSGVKRPVTAETTEETALTAEEDTEETDSSETDTTETAETQETSESTQGTAATDEETATQETASEETQETETETEKTAAKVEGTWYVVKWGDTLWDIAHTYYRDPWEYKKIANHSNNYIPNEDLIFEDQRIWIPNN